MLWRVLGLILFLILCFVGYYRVTNSSSFKVIKAVSCMAQGMPLMGLDDDGGGSGGGGGGVSFDEFVQLENQTKIQEVQSNAMQKAISGSYDMLRR
jgi:hypothetical protein